MSSIRPADEQRWGRPPPADDLGPPPGGEGWLGPGGPSPSGGRQPDRRLPVVVGSPWWSSPSSPLCRSGRAAPDGSGDENAAAAHPELPAVTIPADSSPPTTIPGSEPSSVPGADGDLPLFAHIVVDLQPNGFRDFAVFLRQDQQLRLLSLADDGVETDIEVFAPDGSSEGSWTGGEPGVVNGLEWHGDELLPATGTYVIRVVHTGGSDAPFALGFFGDN